MEYQAVKNIAVSFPNIDARTMGKYIIYSIYKHTIFTCLTYWIKDAFIIWVWLQGRFKIDIIMVGKHLQESHWN